MNTIEKIEHHLGTDGTIRNYKHFRDIPPEEIELGSVGDLLSKNQHSQQLCMKGCCPGG